MYARKAHKLVFQDHDLRAHDAQTTKPVCRHERVKNISFIDNSNLDKEEFLYNDKHLDKNSGVKILASNIKILYDQNQRNLSTNNPLTHSDTNQMGKKQMHHLRKEIQLTLTMSCLMC